MSTAGGRNLKVLALEGDYCPSRSAVAGNVCSWDQARSHPGLAGDLHAKGVEIPPSCATPHLPVSHILLYFCSVIDASKKGTMDKMLYLFFLILHLTVHAWHTCSAPVFSFWCPSWHLLALQFPSLHLNFPIPPYSEMLAVLPELHSSCDS